MLRVIVTGGTTWDNRATMRREFGKLPAGTTIIHGDCTGADALASELATEFGFAVERWEKSPADYAKYRKGAWKALNERMLASGAMLVLAFHVQLYVEGQARGTKHMLELAIAANVETRAFTD